MSSVNYNHSRKNLALLLNGGTSYDVVLVSDDGTPVKTIPSIPDNTTTGACIAYDVIDNIEVFWFDLYGQEGFASMNEFGIVEICALEFDRAFSANWSMVKKIATNSVSVVIVIDDGLGNDYVFVYSKKSLHDIKPVPVHYFQVDASLRGQVDAITLTDHEIVLVGKYGGNSNSTLTPTMLRYSFSGSIIETTTLAVSQTGILDNVSQIQCIKYFTHDNIINVGVVYSTGNSGVKLIEHVHQFRVSGRTKATLGLTIGKIFKTTDGWNSSKSMLSGPMKLQDSLTIQDFCLGIEIDESTNNYMDTFIENLGTAGFRYLGHYPVTLTDDTRNTQTASTQEIETV